jgi:prolyl-tRNA editing enzyme YbaK/EbsC (Cys-tRNA(Pro) deacylase)
VSPVGIRTRLPIILSHRIAQLRPGTFFLGAGEVDLKLGMSASDFIAAYQASARPRGGSPTRRSPQG